MQNHGYREFEFIAETASSAKGSTGILASVGAAGHTGIAEREGLAHDACNLLAAVGLYCDLMSQPGVVTGEYLHYLVELKRLARSSGSLVERLMPRAVHQEVKSQPVPSTPVLRIAANASAVAETEFEASSIDETEIEEAEINSKSLSYFQTSPCLSIASLLAHSHEMLQVLAGDRMNVEVESRLGPGVAVEISEEALTRILVNLTMNAREAMQRNVGLASDKAGNTKSNTGKLRITAQWLPEYFEQIQKSSAAEHVAGKKPMAVLLSVQDSGPGMPVEAVAEINRAGSGVAKGMGVGKKAAPQKSTELLRSRGQVRGQARGRARGLGLKIVRELVENCGGRLQVFTARDRQIFSGTRFEIQLPLAGDVHATMAGTSRNLQLVSRSSSTNGPQESALDTTGRAEIGQAIC